MLKFRQIKYNKTIFAFCITVLLCILIACNLLVFNGIDVKFVNAQDSAVSLDKKTQENNSIFLPILMYHSILKHGDSTFILKPSQLEDDLKELQNRGYTSVSCNDILQYVENQTPLPEKPILITFDDGHYNNLFYALPILKEYNAKAVINIIGVHTENFSKSHDHSNPSYSHLTWEQVSQMQDSGVFEIGNHTYDMHKNCPRYGILKNKKESEWQYKASLQKDLTKLQDKLKQNCDIDTNIFAYPFGKFSKNSKEYIKELGFKMIFTCYEGYNVISPNDTETLQALKRYNRDSKLSTAEFFDHFEKGYQVVSKHK